MSWEYAEPQNKDNPDCMPCIFLQFPHKDENGQDVTKLLQIFSREAPLMDAMIDVCVKAKKKMIKKEGGRDQVDGGEKGAGIIKAQGDDWANFNRMCLATFNKSGKVTKNQVKTQTK